MTSHKIHPAHILGEEICTGLECQEVRVIRNYFRCCLPYMGLKTFSKRNSSDYPQTQLIRYTYRNVKAKTTTETTLGLYQNDIQLRDI